jgi:heme oxygenase
MAHAYVRYLGDLHGGQALRRCVARLLRGQGIEDQGVEGLHFYDFGPPERVAGLILALREALDSMPLDSQQMQAMEQEVRLGFGLHIDLFRQLPHAPAGAGR